MSVTLVLDDEIDISRGDTITAGGQGRQGGQGQDRLDPHVGRRFEADVVWMDERPLDPSRLYLLKHTTRTVTVEANRPLALNQIETVTLTTSRPLVFDRYRDIRATGSFILIDPATNFTAGAGMIIDAIRDDHAVASGRTPPSGSRRSRARPHRTRRRSPPCSAPSRNC